MAKEIERKFLITHLPSSITRGHQPLDIRQGYITDDPAGQQVRIRSKGKKFFLTVKGKGELEREEVEIELSAKQFDILWPLTDGRRVYKRRYQIPYREHTIELDIFEGSLAGLKIAEVEFATTEKSAELDVPDWFGKELTYDHRYTNSQLARSGSIPGAS